jgi:hypothetical protein
MPSSSKQQFAASFCPYKNKNLRPQLSSPDIVSRFGLKSTGNEQIPLGKEEK